MPESTITVQDFLISSNSKTGLSVNVMTCKPTMWCHSHCYARRRNSEEAKRLGSSANNGPVTWRRAKEAYVRNEKVLQRAVANGGVEELAAELARQLEPKLRGRGMELRGNGVGDLSEELCVLYALLAFHGTPIFLFSRLPPKIIRLYDLCKGMGIKPSDRPWCIGSIDPSTSNDEIELLTEATAQINGVGTLAYATSAEQADISHYKRLKESAVWPNVDVVFGYHTSHKKTVIGDEKECPATAGKDIKCTACKRCYSAWRL